MTPWDATNALRRSPRLIILNPHSLADQDIGDVNEAPASASVQLPLKQYMGFFQGAPGRHAFS